MRGAYRTAHAILSLFLIFRIVFVTLTNEREVGSDEGMRLAGIKSAVTGNDEAKYADQGKNMEI